MRYFFIIAGFVSLGLGCAGIVLPGLPTTPFVLLSAGLFLKSSERLYHRLTENRIFGRYIRNYQNRKGMSFCQKAVSLSVMWSMIIFSAMGVDNMYFTIAVISAGIIGTVVMGFAVKTV